MSDMSTTVIYYAMSLTVLYLYDGHTFYYRSSKCFGTDKVY